MVAALDVPERSRQPTVRAVDARAGARHARRLPWPSTKALRFDPEARNLRHTYVAAGDGQPAWRVQQMLVDPEMHNDWVAEFEVDVAASRATQQPVLWLRRIGPLA